MPNDTASTKTAVTRDGTDCIPIGRTPSGTDSPPHGSYSQRYGLYSYGYAPYRLPYLGVNWFWPYYGLPGHGFATRGAFHPGFAYYGCYGYRGYRW